MDGEVPLSWTILLLYNHEAVVLYTKKSLGTAAGVVTQAVVVRYKAKSEFKLVTQASGSKPEKLPTKPVLHLGEFVRICKSLAWNAKFFYKAKQSNRWCSSAMFFQ
jgi:hypothetical protein